MMQSGETVIVIPVIDGLYCPALAFVAPCDPEERQEYIQTRLNDRLADDHQADVVELDWEAEVEVRRVVQKAATTDRKFTMTIDHCFVQLIGATEIEVLVCSNLGWPIIIRDHSIRVGRHDVCLRDAGFGILTEPELVVVGPADHMPRIVVRSPSSVSDASGLIGDTHLPLH